MMYYFRYIKQKHCIMNHPITYRNYIAYFYTNTVIESVGICAPDIKTARTAAQRYKRLCSLDKCKTIVKREPKNN